MRSHASALLVLQRSWTLTVVSFIALAAEGMAIVIAVPLLHDAGAGWVAAAAALGLAASELMTVLLLLRAVGRGALDRATLSALVKCLLLCGVVTVVDRPLLSLGALRFVIDLALYTLGAFAVKGVRIDEVTGLVALIRARRAGTVS